MKKNIKSEVTHVMDEHYGTVYCLVMVCTGIAAGVMWLCNKVL